MAMFNFWTERVVMKVHISRAFMWTFRVISAQRRISRKNSGEHQRKTTHIKSPMRKVESKMQFTYCPVSSWTQRSISMDSTLGMKGRRMCAERAWPARERSERSMSTLEMQMPENMKDSHVR